MVATVNALCNRASQAVIAHPEEGHIEQGMQTGAYAQHGLHGRVTGPPQQAEETRHEGGCPDEHIAEEDNG